MNEVNEEELEAQRRKVMKEITEMNKVFSLKN
jgi:hypothetical protein